MHFRHSLEIRVSTSKHLKRIFFNGVNRRTLFAFAIAFQLTFPFYEWLSFLGPLLLSLPQAILMRWAAGLPERDELSPRRELEDVHSPNNGICYRIDRLSGDTVTHYVHIPYLRGQKYLIDSSLATFRWVSLDGSESCRAAVGMRKARKDKCGPSRSRLFGGPNWCSNFRSLHQEYTFLLGLGNTLVLEEPFSHLDLIELLSSRFQGRSKYYKC